MQALRQNREATWKPFPAMPARGVEPGREERWTVGRALLFASALSLMSWCLLAGLLHLMLR